jgi:C4-dicarboxylate transporter DctM subunit
VNVVEPLLPVVLVLALLVLRQPLLVILLALAALIHLQWGQGRPEYIAEDMWNALDKELVLAIPIFLLCGQVMSRGGTALRLLDILKALTPRIPGGLGAACMLGCALDASISGSSVVTMLAIGSVMLPALLRAGYEKHHALGAVMAGGTLGVIIPPSIPMIVYAVATGTSVVDLFRAGIGPGLLLALVFTAYAVWHNRHLPTAPFDAHALRQALRRGIAVLPLPVVISGGVYGGLFGITESGVLGLSYVVLIELFVYRGMTLRGLYQTVLGAARLTGALLPIIAIAQSLSLVLNEHRVPLLLAQWVQSHVDSQLAFIVWVNLLLLAVGCLLTIDAAILVLAPLLVPLAEVYGYDRVLFGIIMILNLEIGFLTPPVGLNLIVAMAAFRQPFGVLCRAAVPFIVLMLGCLALVVWQPWIALGLR